MKFFVRILVIGFGVMAVGQTVLAAQKAKNSASKDTPKQEKSRSADSSPGV